MTGFREYSPEAQCIGKITYPSKHAAKRAGRHIEHRVRARLQAYHCPHCDGYHLGHRPAPWNFEEPAAS